VRHGDVGLFQQTAHSPSFFELSRRMGDQGLIDFCIPCNPYFPTPDMFTELAKNLEAVLKYYPSDADTIAASSPGCSASTRPLSRCPTAPPS